MIWPALFTYLHLLAAGLAAGLLLGQHWLLKRPLDRIQLGLLGAMALGQLLAAIASLRGWRWPRSSGWAEATTSATTCSC
jgi:hypothetical protein